MEDDLKDKYFKVGNIEVGLEINKNNECNTFFETDNFIWTVQDIFSYDRQEFVEFYEYEKKLILYEHGNNYIYINIKRNICKIKINTVDCKHIIIIHEVEDIKKCFKKIIN